MAPAKRKRDGRAPGDDADGARPSPHRPGNASFGQDRADDMRNGDGRRGGRQRGGGGGGYRGGNGNGGRNSRRESTENFRNSRPGTPTNPAGRMSPPARPNSSSAQALAPAPSPSPAPSTPAPFVARRSPTPEPIKNPAPYDYAHITPARVQSWAATGRQEVIQAGVQALDDVDVLDLSVIFQELVRAGLNGTIKPSDAGACVQEMLRAAPTSTEADSDKIDGPLLFLDSFSIIADAEPHSSSLRYILVASGVSPTLMRDTLDSQLLSSVGLTQNTFTKRGIRNVTNLLYRQSNHNLLREETEGFAKLITELYTTSDRHAPTSTNVEEAFERVKGLIGTFDLDVGRVLDVTLDVFASVLIKRTPFFVKLMRVSSWWPRDHIIPGSSSGTDDLPQWALPGSNSFETTEEDRALAMPAREARDRSFWERAREVGMDAFYELGGRQPVDEATKQRLIAAKSNTSEADRDWIEATGTLPPAGNRTAAQLLGFKLRFYASAARGKDDLLPDNLIYLVALLIKIGFVSLRDLYPHLQPSDDGMEEYRIKMEKEVAEKEKASRPGGGSNALMMAGALADDTLPMNGSSRRDISGSKAEAAGVAPVEAEKEELPEIRNQKALLLINLLTIGAIPESLFMLGRFPWLAEVEPKVYQLLHRILLHSVDKVFAGTKPVSETLLEMSPKKQLDPDQKDMPKGTHRLQAGKTRKTYRWPYPDRHDEADAMSYEFYWKEWCDSIPVCQSVDDIFTLCDTLLSISGVNIGSNATLLSKLASIGNKSLTEDTSEANLSRWRDLLKRLLVPALSHTNSNTNIVNQIYDMLRYYPAPVRYNIYAEWFEGPTTRLPAMVKVFTKARLETLGTMKRISKTNVLQMARALAKTAYANPGIVFKVALGQIEAYSNLTEVVVECAKYFTDLGYDVLVWCLMSSLGGQSRSRTQGSNALLTSKWLLALSNFAGKVFKRFSIMNPAPILQYVNNQVYNGNATDLVILQELIKQMCGIVPDTDFTDSQLLALTGGPVLRRQTLISLQDKRYESDKTSKRLMKSLTDTRLAGQLLVAIAQYRQTALFRVPEDSAYIKYLSSTVDDTQLIMMQYLDLLRSSLTAEQFDELVPNTLDLIAQFGLEPALAFALGRASYAAKMEAAGGTATPQKTIQASTDGDVVMGASEALEKAATNGDVPMSDAVDISTTNDVVTDSPRPSTDSWNDVLQPLIASIPTVLPDKPWDLLSPDFYVAFWQLTLSDIQVPMDSYTSESSRLTKEISELLRIRTIFDADKREKQKKELEDLKDQVLLESKEQMSQFGRNRSRLNKSKVTWFSNVDSRYDALCDALLEECLLPRLLVSPSDADYAFKMIKFMHNTATPHFRTLGLLSRLFKPNRLRVIIFSCTIREAECFGRFLKSILGDLSKWHSSKAVYEKEAWGAQKDLPGFAKSMGPDGKALNLLDYEEFRRILFMWHKNLNNALKTCLAGDEWMHLRNAITVLKGVVDHFPALEFMGTQFMKTLEQVSKREKDNRDDLSLLASASLPELNKRKSKWVMPQAFAINIVSVHHQLSSSNVLLTKPTQAGPDAQANGKTSSGTPEAKTVLKATAPEFKPASASMPNGGTETTTKADAEDGELGDSKSTSAAPQSRQAETARGRQDARNLQDRAVPGRPAHSAANASLPSRPERVQTDRGVPSRGGDRRDVHPSRVDRGLDNSRHSARDVPPAIDRGVADRRDLLKPSSFERPNPRDRFNVNRSGDPFTDSRTEARTRNERLPMLDHRGVDLNAPKAVELERGPPVNPERLAQIVDPAVARAAEAVEPPRSNSPRGHREEKPHSRPHSPRRGDRGPAGRSTQETSAPGPRARNDAPPSRPAHGERISSGRGQATGDNSLSRRELPAARSTDNWGHDRVKDAFRPAPSMPPNVDPDHGRLNQPSRHDDSNFGRLNSAPEIPSGPRQGPRGGSNRQGGQNMSQSQGSSRAPSPGRAPPTGPANDRSGRGRTDSRGPAPSTGAPGAPAAPPVHPERLAHLAPEARAQVAPPTGPSQSSQGASQAPSQQSGGVPPGLHPSRMRDWNDTNSPSSVPPHVQSSQSNARSGPPGAPNAPAPINTAPPSGPRGQNQGAAQNQGSQPSTPTEGGVPTGPSGRERGNRGQSYIARQMGGINNIIKGSERASERSRDRNGADRSAMNVRGRGAVGAPGTQGGNDQFVSNFTQPPPGGNIPAAAPRDPRPSGRRDLGPEPTAPDSTSRSGRRDLGPEPTGPDLTRSKDGDDGDKSSSGRPGSMRDFDRRERDRGRRSGHASRDRTPERPDRSARDAAPAGPGTSSDARDADPNRMPIRDSRSSGDLRRDSGRDRDARRGSLRSGGAGSSHDGARDRADSSRSGRSSALGHRDGPSGTPGTIPPPPPAGGPPMHGHSDKFRMGSQYGPPSGMGGHHGSGRDSRGGVRDDRRGASMGNMGGPPGGPRGPHTPGGGMGDDNSPHGSKRRGDERMDRGREKRPRQG